MKWILDITPRHEAALKAAGGDNIERGLRIMMDIALKTKAGKAAASGEVVA